MTDNRKLEAAIAAGLAADNKIIESLWVKDSEVDQDLLQVSADGATAFAAYRDRFHALEADNERTNRDRSALCIDFALLTEENARLRAALLPFAAIYAAYQRDHNNDPVANVLFGGEETRLNWFRIWMQHDGYKLAQEADYQQAAQLADVEASSTSEDAK